MPSKAIEQLQKERERLREEHLAGASGLSVVRALSDATDEAVRSIWDGEGASLVATGGYGRRELSPHSDIDLVVIHPKPAKVADAVKRLSYELWDAGLEFAQAVYTPKEVRRLADSRVDVELAFRSARVVAGEADLLGRLPSGVTPRLKEAVAIYRHAGGDAGSDLEPNLKEGRGGIRDLGILRLFEDPPGEEADWLHRVRNHLHFTTGRRTDVLSLQLQADAASVIAADEDELLRTIYLACRRIGRALDEVLDPPDEVSYSLLDLLREPAALERADLPAMLPEWHHIYCLPQRNIYHRSAVDTHSIGVVKAAARLAESPDEIVQKVARDSQDDLDTLLVAALLHDIGKGASAEDHALEGSKIAEQALTGIGLLDPIATDVVWLVRNHLLLVETATRRDIGDERLIVEMAEKIGDERRLRLLFLLTVADGLATGPSAWGPWKAALVSTLFTHVAHVIERGELVGTDPSRIAHEREQQVRSAFPGRSVEDHLRDMPRAWLLSQPVEALIHQTALMLSAQAPEEIVLDPDPLPEPGFWQLTVVARDRPGLFSKVAGALALHGLDVAAAEIYTREDGVALEIFRLEALSDESRRFERVREDLTKALKGRIALDVRLAEKRRDYSGRPKGKQEPPQVVVDNFASDFYTVIEVHAPDRVGLLYTITRALADLELDIQLAKVSTYGEHAVDVFYVRDLEGQKIEDKDHVAEIEKTIHHALQFTSP